MVKHVILWTLKAGYTPEEQAKIKLGIKEGLEGLAGRIPGMTEIRVITDTLDRSNADVMLDSTFETAEALWGYGGHPEHVKVADEKVRPYTDVRLCINYEE